MASGRCPAVPASGLVLGQVIRLDLRGPRFSIFTGVHLESYGGTEDVAVFLAAENTVVVLLFLFLRDQSLRLAASAVQGVYLQQMGIQIKRDGPLSRVGPFLVTR